MKVAVLAGDGIGPEIVAQARKVLQALDLPIEFEDAPVGAAAYRAAGHPLPAETLALAKAADAVLFGSVGDPSCDELPRDLRPEQAILGLRRELGLFANLRPVQIYPELVAASSLRPELVSGLDLLIVRELTGDIYFGQPRGLATTEAGRRSAFNTMRYDEDEIRRIAHLGFQAARGRSGRLCSVDKSNVLETSQLWRDVVTETAADYPDVALSHMYVDNAAMQLVRAPKQFDVILTANLFGDILSDQAAMLAGSIGMLCSASLGENARGLYEPAHGSAPEIAGQDCANPLATVLSAAMMLRHSFDRPDAAARIEAAVARVLQDGLRTADIASGDGGAVGTEAMGDALAAAVRDGALPSSPHS